MRTKPFSLSHTHARSHAHKHTNSLSLSLDYQVGSEPGLWAQLPSLSPQLPHTLSLLTRFPSASPPNTLPVLPDSYGNGTQS